VRNETAGVELLAWGCIKKTQNSKVLQKATCKIQIHASEEGLG